MAFPFPSLAGLLARRARLLYASAWTAVATTAVAVAASAPFPFPSLAFSLAGLQLLYVATWTTAVAVATFAPELAFLWAVGPGAPLSRACPGSSGGGFTVGLPLDGPPWDVVCVPAAMLGRSKPDVIVPLVSAAVWFTTAVGVWEDDHHDEPSSPAGFLEQV